MAKFKRKHFRIIWFTLVGIFMLWNFWTYQAHGVPEEDYSPTGNISYKETGDLMSFTVQDSQRPELIFFPGGGVDPDAYIPLARKLAEKGFSIHIVKMPFRMSSWGYDKIIELFDWVNHSHVLGGHSQGGKMAAHFAYEHPGLIDGLFLLGTSHPRDISLADQQLRSIKISAENDGLASEEEVVENMSKMPVPTNFVKIEGGNHSQFGHMGQLLGDEDATISRVEQQAQVVAALDEFF